MTSGRLSGRPAAPIGQTSGPVSTPPPGLAQPAQERDPLGARADHPDIGRVAARQRLARDQEVERVVVGQHDEGRARRAPAAPSPRAAASEPVRSPPAPARAPPRAGRRAPAAPAAAPAPPRARGRHGRRRRSCDRRQRRALLGGQRGAQAPRVSPPSAARHREQRPAAAALADLRPERHVEHLADRRRAPASPAPHRSPCTRAARRRSCRSSDRATTSIHAPASRGVEPRAVSTRTSAAGPASRNAVDRFHPQRHQTPPRRVHRHQHALRRRRRIEPRACRGSRRRSPPPSTAPRAPRRRA